MAEEHDIVARISSSPAGNSIGALAAYLGRCCGHVLLDTGVLAQGYRFYPELGEEIPHFFNRRFTTAATNLAITLQGGMAADGSDAFAGCTSTRRAREIVEHDDYKPTIWLARVTFGARLLDVREVADPLFIARNPGEFRLIGEELLAVGVLQGHACRLCTAEGDDGSHAGA